MTYHLTKVTDECLFISSENGEAELVFISIFYLIAEGDKTVIVGYKWRYTVDINIDELTKLLPVKWRTGAPFTELLMRSVELHNGIGANQNATTKIANWFR
jgi:hypothetical protein